MISQSQNTIRLYDNDSHENEFTALILSCIKSGDFFKIELDRTLFFPEGGGQYADTGTLSYTDENVRNGDGCKVNILDVQIVDDRIFHFADAYIAIGTEVIGKINGEQRFVRMQNHTGEHIVSGLIKRMFGYDNIGFHLGAEDVTCDYNGLLTRRDIEKVEAAANEAVFKNLAVHADYPEPDELKDLNYRSKLALDTNVRIVTIDSVDCCACCAPHVRSTGEIGLIKIVGFEKSHGGTRLHLRCGALALKDYNEKQDNIMRIVDLLSAPQSETADAVEKLIDANSELTHELSKASVALAEARLSAVFETDGNLVVLMDKADTDALRALANGGKQKCSGVFVALTECPDGYRYAVTSSSVPLTSVSKELNSHLSGRGGGNDSMLQGVFSSALPVIEDFFAGWSYTAD